MARFLQLHVLTAYPPSNLNRDDLNRPKTARVGGVQRLRISSQCLKRTWRTSPVFAQAFAGQLGTRTKEMGKHVLADLLARGVAEAKARDWAAQIAGVFGKLKADGSLEIEQLAHFAPEEEAAIADLVTRLAQSGQAPGPEDLALLRRPRGAVDIAMFGRMLAASPAYNLEAAVQVAHAFTVHQVTVEDDFFTAVDDLNQGIEDVGAGHMGELEFGAGLFYLYLCADCALLRENLGGDAALAGRALAALTEAVLSVSPTGKQNSFASRAYASYLLAERGDRQPRSLASAFYRPVTLRNPGDDDPVRLAIKALEETHQAMDRAYGPLAEKRQALDVPGGQGTLAEVLAFTREACA